MSAQAVRTGPAPAGAGLRPSTRPGRSPVRRLRTAAVVGLMTGAILLAWACCGRDETALVRPELPALAPVAAADRIMIVAPHEDDEALMAGGLIQQAVAAGAAVRVVYLTYGDHSEFQFMVYRRRPWVSPTINRNMGEVRRREAVAGTGRLGLAPESLVFLGYPDGGMLRIWKEHWGESPALHSILTNASAVPYRDAASFGRAHKGENVVADLAAELLAFRPTRIVVGHPADDHPDHRASWLFLQAALLETAGRIPHPEVLACPVHAGRWPRPRAERRDGWLGTPHKLAGAPGSWAVLELSDEEVHAKAEAIGLYESQTTIGEDYLLSFARRNELFARIPAVRLVPAEVPEPAGRSSPPAPPDDDRQPKRDDPAWTFGGEPGGGHGGGSDGGRGDEESDELEEELAEEEPAGGPAWRDSGAALVVEVPLPRGASAGGVFVQAFGFRSDRPFAASPRLAVSWAPGWLKVCDQGTRLPRTGVRAFEGLGSVTLVIPWAELGDPERVFVQVGGSSGEVSAAQSGWRLLERVRDREKP